MEAIFVVLLLGAVALGAIPAFIAESKGRSFLTWWLYGSLIFIVAVIHSIVIKPDGKIAEQDALAADGRKCPHCAEVVKMEAKVCRFCQRDLPSIEVPSDAQLAQYKSNSSTNLLQHRLRTRLTGVVVVFVMICGFGFWHYQSVNHKGTALVIGDASDDFSHVKNAAKLAEASTQIVYLPMDEMVVHLADLGGDRVARVGITLEVRDADGRDIVKAYMPTIKDDVLKVLSQRTTADLQSNEGKQKLIADILRKASLPFGGDDVDAPAQKNKVALEYPVVGVIFSSLIVQ